MYDNIPHVSLSDAILDWIFMFIKGKQNQNAAILLIFFIWCFLDFSNQRAGLLPYLHILWGHIFFDTSCW